MSPAEVVTKLQLTCDHCGLCKTFEAGILHRAVDRASDEGWLRLKKCEGSVEATYLCPVCSQLSEAKGKGKNGILRQL